MSSAELWRLLSTTFRADLRHANRSVMASSHLQVQQALVTPIGSPTVGARDDSRRLARGHFGKVDVRLGDFVDVIRPGIERYMQHDLDDRSVVVAG